jgi:hypothetical protein
MTFSHINRRAHLYLALALLPWFFMYGASSVPFAHSAWFEQRDAARGLPLWTKRLERTVDVTVPTEPEALRALGRILLTEAGIEGMDYGVYRANPNQINVYAHSFWNTTELKYFTDRKVLTAEDRRFRWDHFLTGMHARGGFAHDTWLQQSWSVVVDVVQIGILLWIASGLVMWWELRGHRRWGVITILAGTTAFFVFAHQL